MLNAYISKEDILKLLNETEDIGGFVNRSDFQKKIGTIKCIKQPKPKEVLKIRIKNREMLISSIEAYLSKANNQKIKPKIILYFEEQTKINLTNGKYVAYKTGRTSEEDGAKIDFNKMAIDANDVMQILNISKPTFLRFKKIGVIKKDSITINLYVNEIRKLQKFPIWCYNLEETKTNLER